MAEHVEALRCGLDANQWEDERSLARNKTRRERCIELIGEDTTERLPFDLKRAHGLYKGLLGPFADLIESKRLLVVVWHDLEVFGAAAIPSAF